MAQDDIAPLLIGAGALLVLAKWGFGNIPDIPNPLPAAGRAVAKTADELTGGCRRDRTKALLSISLSTTFHSRINGFRSLRDW